MNGWELLILSVGLAMDAFAVSVCKGLAAGKVGWRHIALAGVWFGGFQALMPLIGFLLGGAFRSGITAFDHWIAFGLLLFLGGKMIFEALRGTDEPADASFSPRAMFLLALATSIDALAVGITFALLPDVNIGIAVGSIGVVTFLLSAVGVKLGSVCGGASRKWSELAGGVILILIGTKILLEHLGVIAF